MNRIRKVALLGVAALPVVVGGFLAQDRRAQDGARLLNEVLQLVSSRFVDTLDASALYEKAARGLVHELNDPYTELLSPKQYQGFSTRTGGRYGGVGMQIEDQQGNITVARVFPHTPAEEAGILEGDRIVTVDTLAVHGWKLSQVSDYLLGTPGTKVTVKFNRPGVSDPIQVRFTRAVIHIPAVPYAMMLDSKIGYIPLQQFNETASDEVEGAIKRLQKEGARGLVLDLRNDPGGILDQALSVSNLFLKKGQPIVSVRGRTTEPKTMVATGNPIAPTVPLVVLTDGYSASASEIVAGALQDHDRALIVGTTSFGKGLVQTLFQLDDGYALKITTAKWYTPSGRSIQKERKVVDGRFVDDSPDSLETDTVKQNRPAYKSDAGRTVYGGGAITPDIIVRPDTLTTAEQNFVKAFAPKSQQTYVVLSGLALELKSKVTKNFTVQPAWREEFYRRLAKSDVKIDRALYDSAAAQVNRLLDNRISRYAFGDSVAKRRELGEDTQLKKAIDVLQKGQTQKDLFVIAQREVREQRPPR